MRALPLFCSTVVLALVPACAEMQVGVGPSRLGLGVGDPSRTTDIAHEPCAVEGGASSDHDGDGKHDTVSVVASGREVCRAIDVDKDGKHDVFLYFDPNGGVRREERSARGGGRVVTTFSGTGFHRAHADGEGKVERVEEHEKGRPVRTFIDVNRDGKFDQVWSWMDRRPGCAAVVTDKDHDGKVDHEHETCVSPAGSGSR